MKKLNICHVITRMIVGGAQENTLLTAIGHIENGHRVSLVTGPSQGPEGELLKKKKLPTELKIVECPFLVREINPLSDIRAYFFLKNFFSKNCFDVVHTHSSKAGIIGRVAASALSIPTVLHTIHGLAFHAYEKKWKNYIYKTAERQTAKKCDKILAVAQAMVEQCVSAKIASRDKFKVVYSGMELDSYRGGQRKEKGEEIRIKFGIPKNSPVIGSIARLFPLKGYEDFVPAAAKIAKELPDVHFLIVGDGIMMDLLKKQALELGLNFHFTGLVPPEEIPFYASAMNVLLHLSLREGLPRAVVQALAAGKPAVAYSLDGAPEVVFDGKTGYLIKPSDIDSAAHAVVKIIKNHSLSEKMGSEGQKLTFEKFDWKTMVQEIEKEYFSIITSKQERI